MKLPTRYQNIAPSTKSRRWLIPLSVLGDILPLALGILVMVFFPLLTRWYIHLIGAIITFVSGYRIVYHILMSVSFYMALVKNQVTDVWELVSALSLKTPSDVLAIFYRLVKHGYLIGYGSTNLKIYKVNTKKQ